MHIKNVAANRRRDPPNGERASFLPVSSTSPTTDRARCPGRARRGKDSVWVQSPADPTLYTPRAPDILISVDRFSDLYKTRNRSRAYSRVRSPCPISLLISLPHSPSLPFPFILEFPCPTPLDPLPLHFIYLFRRVVNSFRSLLPFVVDVNLYVSGTHPSSCTASSRWTLHPTWHS